MESFMNEYPEVINAILVIGGSLILFAFLFCVLMLLPVLLNTTVKVMRLKLLAVAQKAALLRQLQLLSKLQITHLILAL